jgi:hypothetical protein
MGKRSDFKKRKNDAYFTPIEAVIPLIPHLPQGDFVYAEPCAGDRRLVEHISTLTKSRGRPSVVTDIDPQSHLVTQMDAIDVKLTQDTDLVITNPPWSRWLLHPMIEHFANQAPTWFLFDADWMHTKQAIPYLEICRKIVSIGRVKWIEESKGSGKDNSCWYLFDANTTGRTIFYGR